MMPGLMTPAAREVSMRAYDHAIRLGHRYLGGEHFLLALAAAGQPAGEVLRGRGVTPGRVEAEITRLAGGGLFGDLDRSALAAIGIDVDAVRGKMESSFSRAALRQADLAVEREPDRRTWDPRRRTRSGAERDGVFLPHGPGVPQALQHARQMTQAGRESQVDVQHLALGLLRVTDGLAPAILSGLGVSAPTLRSAIADRYRQAS
jgi:ATP-dependent Clp protease ATP-binding subunit ClpA